MALRYAAKRRRLLRANGRLIYLKGFSPFSLSRPRLLRGRIEGHGAIQQLAGKTGLYRRGSIWQVEYACYTACPAAVRRRFKSYAVLINAMCVKACGKLPRCSPR